MKSFLFTFILFALSFFSVLPANAAQYYLRSSSSTFPSEGFFQVDVYLDSQGEVINAFEGNLVLPSDLVSIVDMRTGGSFVSFWVKPPAQTSVGNVSFAGIFPGGFSGDNAYLFSVIGQVKGSSARLSTSSPFLGNISMQNMSVLLHDGLGSPASVSFRPFQFAISRAAATIEENREVLQANDQEPPELFEPVVTQDENLFEGQLSLVFSTQDKGVGVSHYEVFESEEPIENTQADIPEEAWERIESPYLLQDQSRSRFVYVKAVDKVGNERIVVIPAQHPLGGYSNTAIWGIISSVILVLLVLALVLWRYIAITERKTSSKAPKANKTTKQKTK